MGKRLQHKKVQETSTFAISARNLIKEI